MPLPFRAHMVVPMPFGQGSNPDPFDVADGVFHNRNLRLVFGFGLGFFFALTPETAATDVTVLPSSPP
jgi:hypothetical protein